MVKYLTFFDRNYLARGVLMIESLRTVTPNADILVFAIDVETERMLGHVFGDQVTVLPPDYVAKRWPNLELMRSERKHWEFIAMRKPCLIRSVLKEEMQPNELLFYVDSDTQFFASPEPEIGVMDTASIGISPHEFPEEHKQMLVYGEFNAGFMIIRNDELGLTCMRHWADDCFKWCHAEAVDGKFMNQGYLTRWPKRYPGVVRLEHPGLNLAPWNIEGRRLHVEKDALHVNGQPLIFFHFHDMKRSGGEWRNASTLISPERYPDLFEKIYDPHTAILKGIEERLVGFGFDLTTPIKDKLASAEKE